MNKAQKESIVESLTAKFKDTNVFYLADASGMTVEEVNNLRRKCFEKGIHFKVAKNTLISKAFDASEIDYEEMKQLLHGPTAILFTDTANLPAKVIKDFRGNKEKPLLKGAYINQSVFIGDDRLDELIKLKSKEELIGDVILLLQSPMQNVLSALQSGGNTIAGLVKTLEERGSN